VVVMGSSYDSPERPVNRQCERFQQESSKEGSNQAQSSSSLRVR